MTSTGGVLRYTKQFMEKGKMHTHARYDQKMECASFSKLVTVKDTAPQVPTKSSPHSEHTPSTCCSSSRVLLAGCPGHLRVPKRFRNIHFSFEVLLAFREQEVA